MAASRNGAPRRRWFVALSLVAAMGTMAVGALLWRAVTLSSVETVSVQVNDMKPWASALRLMLIGLLAIAWSRLPALRGTAEPSGNARWNALRWRVIGWLLVIELLLGQNLVGHLAHAIAGARA